MMEYKVTMDGPSGYIASVITKIKNYAFTEDLVVDVDIDKGWFRDSARICISGSNHVDMKVLNVWMKGFQAGCEASAR